VQESKKSGSEAESEEESEDESDDEEKKEKVQRHIKIMLTNQQTLYDLLCNELSK